MKSIAAIATALALSSASAFSSSSSFVGSKAMPMGSVSNEAVVSMEYIPSGMSKDQWQKLKNKEKSANKGKNLGATGITTFKSRSFSDWQKSGGKNLFPVDPKSVKDASELPYMQRPGGKADGSDLKKNGGGGWFGAGKKKEEPQEPAAPKTTNWWTL